MLGIEAEMFAADVYCLAALWRRSVSNQCQQGSELLMALRFVPRATGDVAVGLKWLQAVRCLQPSPSFQEHDLSRCQ